MRLTKEKLGWPAEPPFLIPEPALRAFSRRRSSAASAPKRDWNERMRRVRAGVSRARRASCSAACAASCPTGWDADIPIFPADAKGMATRVAGGKVMNAIAPRLPALIGGSADLDPSTHTALKGLGDFNPPLAPSDDTQGSDGGGWSYAGRNLHFGVREHAMGAIVNGLAAHGGIIPFGATFLIFSDYMRPPIRLAALMGLHVDPRVHPRQHRAGRGRPDAPAGRAARRPARDSRT